MYNKRCLFAETDNDFDPLADKLVDDYDDERTLEEEEELSNEDSVGRELDDLQKVCLLMTLYEYRLPVMVGPFFLFVYYTGVEISQNYHFSAG